MILEIVKHLFGLCGEGHPHLFTFSPLVVGIMGYYYYIKKKRSLLKIEEETFYLYYYINEKIKRICKKIWYRCMTTWGMQQEEL